MQVLKLIAPEGHKPDLNLIIGEDLVKQTLEDTRTILSIAGIENPEAIILLLKKR